MADQTNIDEISERFPLDKARDGQLDTIKYIIDSFSSGKRFVILEAPTGAGKSVIAMTVARFYATSYYLTIQKILQDQLNKDFGEGGRHGEFLIDLKGRNAYECTYKLSSLVHTKNEIDRWNRTAPHDCGDGHCRRKGESSYQDCIVKNACPYYVQVNKAKASSMCLMNFASFLHQTTFTKRFGKRSLLILDEGHNIESQLMDFVAVTLSDYHLDLQLPESDDLQLYAKWMVDNDVIGRLKDKINKARIEEDTRTVDELDAAVRKLENLLEEVNAGETQWVAEFSKYQGSTGKEHRKVVFKPIYVKKYAAKYLFDWADYILIMSATILDVGVIAKSLGIDRSQIAAKRMASRFPVEKRPIYYKPAVKVTGGRTNMHVWAPKLISTVNEIMDRYEGKRGIIHTHNFSIADLLVGGCNDNARRRFLYQKEFRNKTEMLEYHDTQTDSVIVAPAMHEGVDLKDDSSRFQIVCKVPFPNQFEDKQLAARMELDPDFYQWLTALKLVQCVGRSVRSEDDWADTFIIDESFGWWYERHKRFLPTWFKEALHF